MSFIQEFWGKELRPGQVETIQSTSKSLTIRGASISDSAVDTGTMQDSSAPAQLLLTLKTGSERYLDFPICTFIPGKVEYVHLQITIPLKERVRIEARGRHAIYVYGNLFGEGSGVSPSSSTKRTAAFEDGNLPQNKRVRSGRSGVESIDLTSPDASTMQPVIVAGSKNPAGETAKDEHRGPAKPRLSDPIADRQFFKSTAFEVNSKEMEAKPGEGVIPSNQATSYTLPTSESSLSAKNSAVVSPKAVFSAWVDDEEIEVEEYDSGEGEPCQKGCVVELQYVVTDNATSEYLVKNSDGGAEPQSLIFTVGDKSIPQVLNCAVKKARLNSERSMVIPSGMLRGKMALPFSTDVEILFEFQVAEITWVKQEGQGESKKPVSQ